MKITKRQLRRIIREERAKLHEAQMADGTLEGWAMQDDAVEMIDPEGIYEMYTDESAGEEELNYIIKRLREAYALGGGVAKITIYDMKPRR